MSHSEIAPILDKELILAVEDEMIEAQGYTTKRLKKLVYCATLLNMYADKAYILCCINFKFVRINAFDTF